MKNITLKSMTRELCHELFRHFEADPAVFRKDQAYRQYQYMKSGCDSYYERQKALGRIHLAIMLNDRPIGEIILKNIDREQSSCRLSIHLMNDSVNAGVGIRIYNRRNEMCLRRCIDGESAQQTCFGESGISSDQAGCRI